MTGLHQKISAFAVIVGMLATTGALVFAEVRHPLCDVKQHDCGKSATISSCCCAGQSGSDDAGTPAQLRTELSPAATSVLAVPTLFNPVTHATLPRLVDNSPPRSHPLDLPTLFAGLLI